MEIWNPEKWFSEMDFIFPIPDTYEKTEVVFLQQVTKKMLSHFFKIPSGLAGNGIERQVVKLCKKWFFYF
jgi:hypothetical protein